jgi:uncharacterized protein YcaQ
MMNFIDQPNSMMITKKVARRFMLIHHGLFPPRQRRGNSGILDYIKHVGCIQFDPINIVGRNPDLVLQSRIKDYQPKYLDELLYSERKLIDGWDKMASIYSVEDWPNFIRRKESIINHPTSRRPPQYAIDNVIAEIHERGPLSSLDFDETEKVDWSWGPTKLVRADLEQQFAEGRIGISHRVNNRRYFELINKLIPTEILRSADPFRDIEAYQDWHITRRIGGMGLVNSKSGEYWYGIMGVKSKERHTIIQRLIEKGELVTIGIDKNPNEAYYIRRQDFSSMTHAIDLKEETSEATIIAALDNLIWNRKLIQNVFDFYYIWEVYKPKSQRKFGYYVLPVIYGDRFIARFEPKFDKTNRIFSINNWWWEDGVSPNNIMEEALVSCFKDFSTYLNAGKVELVNQIQNNKRLRWVKRILD